MRTTIKRIHVNQHAIRRNAKLPKGSKEEPVLTVQNRGKSIKAFRINFNKGFIVQGQPVLSCGARVWIETRDPIWVDGVEII